MLPSDHDVLEFKTIYMYQLQQIETNSWNPCSLSGADPQFKNGVTYIPYVVLAILTLFMSHMNIINCHVCTLDNHGTGKKTSFQMSGKWQSYEASFKLKVAEFAEKHGNKAAGREFLVSEKICEGLEEEKGRAAIDAKLKRAGHPGGMLHWPELHVEWKLVEWVQENRKNGRGLCGTMVRVMAKLFARKWIFMILLAILFGCIISWTVMILFSARGLNLDKDYLMNL